MNTPLLNRQLVALFFVATVLAHFSIMPGSTDAQTVNASVVNFSPGGQNIVNMDDTSNGVGNDFAIYQDQNCFDFDTATQIGAFSLAQTTGTNTLRLDGFGVGIGTNPFAELHLLGGGGSPFINSRLLVENVGIAQDRTLLDLQNNGAVIMNLLDTSQPGATPFIIRTTNSRMQFQKTGGATQAGMTIFADGNIRYSINGVPNLTVKPNGNMNIIGQPGGGNLNVLGPTGGAGNLFVKGNISYNGTLTGPSDRNIKENFTAIDSQEILNKVVKLPITKWNYKADKTDTPHLGPMAQDFAATFGLGDDNKRIPLMDSDGVALAAIQGLHQIATSTDKKIKRQEAKITEQKQALVQQQKLILELQAKLQDQSEWMSDLTRRLERMESRSVPK